MSDAGDKEKPIRRILIAIDASPHSLAALRAAVELAAHLNAELDGMFVEDINLLRISDLPFTRQVSFYSATLSQVDRTQIEQQLRAQAAQARRALQAYSDLRKIRSSFRVTRGVIQDEVLNAALESDLVILGRTGWSRRRRLGSTTRVIVAQSQRHALILQQGMTFNYPLGVIYDGSAYSERALQLALSLRKSRDDFIYIIILALSADRARELQDEADRWMMQRGVHAHFHWLISASANILNGIVRTEHLGALLIPAQSEALTLEILTEMLNETQIPVLLVR